MDNQNTEANDLIVQAREALRRGDKDTAHKLGEQAALQAPEREDAWLVLAASDPNPEDALAYAQQALEINPSSGRALKAVEWAIAQLKQAQATGTTAAPVEPTAAPVAVQTTEQVPPATAKKSNTRLWIFAAVALVLLLCGVVIFSAYTGLTHSPFASILSPSAAPTQEKVGGPMILAKPAKPADGNNGSNTNNSSNSIVQPQQDVASTPTPQAVQATQVPVTQDPANSAPAGSNAVLPSATLAAPTDAPTTAPTATAVPTDAATATPSVTETPGVMSMQIVADTPTSQYVPPTSSASGSSAPLPAAAASSGSRWIDVDLTNQRVYAYEGNTVVNSFLVSTGTWQHPTVTGQYNIYVKYRSAPMSGPGYYLPNVPYIMYFYKGYGLHGTYWHHNFGTPMSHGCVNLQTDEAGWLYNWASVGTLVNIHY